MHQFKTINTVINVKKQKFETKARNLALLLMFKNFGRLQRGMVFKSMDLLTKINRSFEKRLRVIEVQKCK